MTDALLRDQAVTSGLVARPTQSAADDETRPSALHTARVYLAQARHFRERAHRLGWSLSWPSWLLNRAGKYRRMAAAEPTQRDLFAKAGEA